MKHLKSMFTIRGKKIGLIFVREQGLDLEVWDGRSCPCWSVGILRTGTAGGGSQEPLDIPKVGYWLLVLPTYLCTTRCIQLPSSCAEEIAAMLEFEIPQLAPCSTQSWTWDFCVTNSIEDGESQVLVVLSPLSVVESTMEQVRSLGIEPSLVTVGGALHTMRSARDNNGDGTKLRGQVWWDHGCLDFSATEGSKLVFLRGVRVAGRNSQVLECVEAEVARSLSMLRERGLGDGDLSIGVGGADPQILHLVDRLRQSASACADRVATYEASSIGDAIIGGAIRGFGGKERARFACVNLLPKHRKEKDRRARRRRELLGIGLRACVIALLMLLCLRMSVWRQMRVLRQHQQRLAQISPLAQKLQFLQGQLNMIRTQVQGSVSMLDIIGQMYEVLPQGVTIHYLSIDQNRQVVIRAQAERLSHAFECIDPLERSVYLCNVRQNYAHQRELEGQVLIDFELRADLERHSTKEAGL